MDDGSVEPQPMSVQIDTDAAREKIFASNINTCVSKARALLHIEMSALKLSVVITERGEVSVTNTDGSSSVVDLSSKGGDQRLLKLIISVLMVYEEGIIIYTMGNVEIPDAAEHLQLAADCLSAKDVDVPSAAEHLQLAADCLSAKDVDVPSAAEHLQLAADCLSAMGDVEVPVAAEDIIIYTMGDVKVPGAAEHLQLATDCLSAVGRSLAMNGRVANGEDFSYLIHFQDAHNLMEEFVETLISQQKAGMSDALEQFTLPA